MAKTGQEVDPKLILQTQESLGKFIRKPPLNEKLLNKPPFKFLHDIITSVINGTGFMKDVFSEHELISENVKDRDGKIAFLQKAVDHVVSVTNEPLKMRPNKTVAGQEADKTNLFLQALAKAIESSQQTNGNVESKPVKEEKKSRSSSRSRVPENDKNSENNKDKSKSSSKLKEEKKRPEKSKTTADLKKTADKKAEHINGSSRTKEKTKEPSSKLKDGQREKSRSRSKPRDEEKSKLGSKPSKELNGTTNSNSSSRRQSVVDVVKEEKRILTPKSSPAKKIPNGVTSEVKPQVPVESKEDAENKEKEFKETSEMDEKKNDGNSISKLSRSDTMILVDVNVEAVQEKEMEPTPRPSTSTIRKASARPSTARPAAPRVRVVDTATTEILSPQVSKPVGNIIQDGESAKDDDDIEFQNEDLTLEKEDVSVAMAELENQPHGSLVTQILETKKGLEHGSKIGNAGVKQEGKSVLSESARMKERASRSREMETLREGIQKLTSCANPLGKLIGYLQEDIEIMNREIEMWKSESNKLGAELNKENSKGDQDKVRLASQIQEVEDEIESKLNEIFLAKSRTLRNDERLLRMIYAS